ncbi:MAG: chorismate synthase [Oscillospiraceae bacterium]|nr:chorismate synthase [Oscillospiraceae bacterium]
MSSTWGDTLKLSIFGESHGPAIGVVLDGLPAGEEIDMEQVLRFMDRRRPGKDPFSTPRKESDLPRVLSGVYQNRTTGTPLAAMIQNSDTHSGDYSELASVARPSHGDFTGFIRYHGFNDPRGGGHFSGRLTAPLVFAGALAIQMLERRGIYTGAHLASVAEVADRRFSPVSLSKEELLSPGQKAFPVLEDKAGEEMRERIETARMDRDSVGGTVECGVIGLPAGVGSPMFGGVENVLSSILFGIPAVKGVEFGLGFEGSRLTGSQYNDSFCLKNGEICTATNHHGGILGGITSGMPLLFSVAFKPTPSISQPQQTVDFISRTPKELVIKGRHDPCVVPRAVPCVEAAAALGVLSLLLDGVGGGFDR